MADKTVLGDPIGVRFPPDLLSAVESWRDHLAGNPDNGVNLTLGDSVRSLVKIATAVPRVKAAISKSAK